MVRSNVEYGPNLAEEHTQQTKEIPTPPLTERERERQAGRHKYRKIGISTYRQVSVTRASALLAEWHRPGILIACSLMAARSRIATALEARPLETVNLNADSFLTRGNGGMGLWSGLGQDKPCAAAGRE